MFSYNIMGIFFIMVSAMLWIPCRLCFEIAELYDKMLNKFKEIIDRENPLKQK